jgi:hypothetical protein
MLLSDLLGREVETTDGESLGRVHDVLVVQDGPLGARGMAALRLHALAVGPRSFGTALGYAQGTVRGPWLLRKLFAKRPRIVPWVAIVRQTDDRIVVDPARLDHDDTSPITGSA